MRALIAGGGIGGLTAALALARAGTDVCILERSEYESASNAGIQISPNASRVLESLDLGSALEKIASEARAIEVRSHRSGVKVAEIALGAAARMRYGAPYYHVHRGELVETLRNAAAKCQRIEIETAATVTEIESSDNHVTVRTATSDTRHADLLIGADGVHSTVLQYISPGVEPRFTGMAAWRALVPTASLPSNFSREVVTLWPGPGAHVVHYPVSNNRYTNFIACVERDDWKDPSWTSIGTRTGLERDFKGWHSTIQTLIANVDVPHLWALFDREPLNRWSKGNVTLLGDACHPMLPFAAQGAAQAIEDAWTLAACLNNTADISQSLSRYQQIRQARSKRVQEESLRRATQYHQRSSLKRIATLLPIISGPTDAAGWSTDSMDWLYGHDVTTGQDL